MTSFCSDTNMQDNTNIRKRDATTAEVTLTKDDDKSDKSGLFSSLSQTLPRFEKIAHLAWNVVHYDSLPDWLKDNEFLHFHHRPPMYSITGCIKSMFRMHTETWNIWTHLMGFLFFVILTSGVYCFRDYITHLFEDKVIISELPWQEQSVIFAFFLGAMTCLFCSTAFHTLCNHSEKAYSLLSRLDYLGIAILITGSGVPFLYYCFYCTTMSRNIHIIVTIILCITCISISLWNKFSQPKYRVLRSLVFVLFGLYGIIPLVQLIIREGFAQPYLKYALGMVIMGVFYLAGTSLYVFRVPERFFPGKFDVWAHSHQLFHVCVLAAAVIHYDTILSMVRDRLDMGPEECGTTLELLIGGASS